jgi:hypothetical protein
MIPLLFIIFAVGAKRQDTGWTHIWFAQCSQPNETHPRHRDFVIHQPTLQSSHSKNPRCKWGPISVMCGTVFNNPKQTSSQTSSLTDFMQILQYIIGLYSLHCILFMTTCSGTYLLTLGSIDQDRSGHSLLDWSLKLTPKHQHNLGPRV